MTPDDTDRALNTYWRQQVDWAMPDKTSWSYEERREAISLDMTCSGNPGWKGDAQQGHSLQIVGAGFFAPNPLRRPKDQDQSATWMVAFPRYVCWATTIHLPKASGKLFWSLYAEPMNQRLGGVVYWRNSGMAGGLVRTVMSSHIYEPEATAAEAEIVNRTIPNFNNNMSNVAEETPENVIQGVSSRLPFQDNVDWVNAPAPCSPGS